MIRHIPYLKSIVSLSLAVVFFSGCGGGDGFKGDRGTVSGKITVEGAPVPKGSQVMFVGASAGYMATGVVGDDGKYSLQYNGSAKLPAIKYLVQVLPPAGTEKTSEKTSAKAAATINPKDMAAMTLPSKKPDKKADESGPFPKMYSSTTSSNLVFEVKAGANIADFPLDPIKAKKKP